MRCRRFCARFPRLTLPDMDRWHGGGLHRVPVEAEYPQLHHVQRFMHALAQPGGAMEQAQAARAVELASQRGVGKGVGMYLHLRPSRVRFSPSDCHYTVFTRSPLPSLLMDGYQLCGSGFTAGDFHRVEHWTKSAPAAALGLLKLDVQAPSK